MSVYTARPIRVVAELVVLWGAVWMWHAHAQWAHPGDRQLLPSTGACTLEG